MKLNDLFPALAITLAALTLAACDDKSEDPDPVEPQYEDFAVIATRTDDYDSGAVSLIRVDEPHYTTNDLAATISDIFVRSGGDHYFVVRRFGTNQIQRYEAIAPPTSIPTYTYSTQDAGDGDTDSNPSDLVVVSDTKAYLLRYGSGKLWIVNPSALSEAAFKTGEIDLSGYDVDGVPDMTAGLLKDGKLYVAMQRLEGFSAVKNSYVAVIDTATDTEVQTGDGIDPSAPKGLELPVRNVSSLVAIPGSGSILAIAAGGYGDFPDYIAPYDGGIVRIDPPPAAYAATLIVDDGDVDTHPYGQFGDIAVAAADRGYFVGSTGFGADQTLYRFDASAAASVPVAVSGFGPLALGSLAIDPDGKLWVARTDSTAPGVSVLGFAGGAETVEASLLPTTQIPINIDFVTSLLTGL
jgi:hypothetical protein